MQLSEDVIGLLVSRENESFQRAIREGIVASGGCSLREVKTLDTPFGSALRGVLCDLSKVEKAFKDIEKWREEGISVSCGYGLRLKLPILPPPFVVFSKGREISSLGSSTCVSIVGARKSDKFGSDAAQALGKLAAFHGNTVISGLALGIDGASHSGALDAGADFPTVAVLGNGIKVCYPSVHRGLAARILDSGGMLLSEYEPEERPLPYRFLERNRIIASLSFGTVVIQASGKSGSLATARFALEAGREVLVLPGAFGDPRYEGSHRLIQHGAYLLSSPVEMFDLIPALKRRSESVEVSISHMDLTESQRKFTVLLQEKGTLHIEELRAYLGNPPTFAEDLLNLELEEIVHHEPGDFISVRSFAIP